MAKDQAKIADVIDAHESARSLASGARSSLRQADLAKIPGILSAMGRTMSPDAGSRWLLAVERMDIHEIRKLAIHTAGKLRDGPGSRLMREIVGLTAEALALADVEAHHRASGTIPVNAATKVRMDRLIGKK